MQWEVQTLQCLNDEKTLKNDSFNSEDNKNSFIMKQTHSSTFIKQQAENHMSSQLIKRNLCSECLSIYTEKSIQEHLNFVHSVETVFCLMSENFLTD